MCIGRRTTTEDKQRIQAPQQLQEVLAGQPVPWTTWVFFKVLKGIVDALWTNLTLFAFSQRVIQKSLFGDLPKKGLLLVPKYTLMRWNIKIKCLFTAQKHSWSFHLRISWGNNSRKRMFYFGHRANFLSRSPPPNLGNLYNFLTSKKVDLSSPKTMKLQSQVKSYKKWLLIQKTLSQPAAATDIPFLRYRVSHRRCWGYFHGSPYLWNGRLTKWEGFQKC